MKKYVLASTLNEQACKTIIDLGYEIIDFMPNQNVDSRIAHHADLSFFVCDKDIFIAKEMSYLAEKFVSLGYYVHVIDTWLGKEYPSDVKLNCVLFGEYFLCNVDTVSENVLNYIRQKGKTVINVNQGYTKCSVIPVADNAIITDDESVSNKCTEYGIDVLKIKKGNVILDGFDYGFIGGTAGLLFDDIIAFNGDVLTHPDGEKIIEFISKYKKRYVSLAENTLVDIGSIICLSED